MEIRQIKYFIQVCKDKSLSKAAKNINISQQGLSKVIKGLEDELGIPLLYRSSKGVAPTKFGELLLMKSQKVINEFNLMTEFLYDSAKLEKGTINLGLPQILYTHFFADLICRFQEKYPDIKLKIVESGSYVCEKNMEENLVDIAFVVKPVNTKKFKFIPICANDTMLLVNKENLLAQKSDLSINDLKAENFIMMSPENKLRQLVLNACLKLNFIPNIKFETSQIGLVIEMVGLNKGIAVLPESIILNAEKINDKVLAVHFKDTQLKIYMGFIVKRTEKLNYITNIFINYALDFFKDK